LGAETCGDALRLASSSPIPDRLLVIGGGIIAMEMATVYQALGSRITIVESETAYTELTEKQAKAQDISYAVSVFPWSASGSAIGEARKLIHHAETGVLLMPGFLQSMPVRWWVS